MKILVSDNLAAVGVDLLKQEKDLTVDVKTGMSKEELIAVIPEYQGLIVRSATKVTADVIEAATNLKVIGRAGIGVDNIDVEAAGKKGIIVMNAPEGNVITTAEHALALMMSMSRNIPQANQSVQNKEWAPKKFMGVELHDKTLGIVGLGRIGTVVADRAKAFHMKVIVYDPFISADHAAKVGVEIVELHDLLARSDYLSLHAPSTAGGKALLGPEEFKIAKPGIRIINCARGSLIDDQALVDAVKNKTVAQAALDVYHKEPLAEDSPLRGVDEIILTPHLGASTEEAQEKVAVAISDQLIDFLKYGNVRNAVNMPSIDAETLNRIRPYLALGEELGLFISQLAEGAVKKICVQYKGDVANLNVDPITTSVIKGALTNAIEGLNMVNAPFIAKERGIEVQESKSNEEQDYTSSVSVTVTTQNGDRSVMGSIFGKGDSRIIKIDEYYFEALLSKYMLVLTNHDVPGVIGNLGNVLGKNQINIAGFHLGRLKETDKAVAVINIDSAPTSEAVRELRETPSILSVHSVKL
ncbi:MAG: phosphoglycerate dehydrogenase [Candidatus Nitrohelix vancouverensis]|uniref:D-3-phosphoglycerate dehydrogenase n=1 Tax=Candidatus Nitrohelix vancouverensis TaxID=2705534 RepID=A0A7T0C1Z3_9BACT|nr:MAG: phosphoglycerate dehydrogenase [Candidatus Nitrohelix vancouverensis]